jgi:hypothetical protein
MVTQIYKHPNHSHFFITDGVLCESYKTSRGLRWREMANVDTDEIETNVSEERALELINKTALC